MQTKQWKHPKIYIGAIIAVALILKVWMASLGDGFLGDTNGYWRFAKAFLDNGFSMYKMDPSIDYPPLYIVLLSPLVWIYQRLVEGESEVLFRVLVKIIPIIADFFVSYIIFITIKKWLSIRGAYVVALFYLMHPAIIINSSFWGQTDSILTICIIVSLLAIGNNKPILTAALLALALILKPTAIMFLPLFFMIFIKKTSFSKIIKSAGAFLIILILISLAFKDYTILDTYLHGVGAYKYASLHAFNFHTMIGADLVKDSKTVLFDFITYKHIGYGMMAFSFAYLFYYYVIKKSQNYLVTAYIYACSVFMWMPRMHERYMYFVIAIGIIAWPYIKKKKGIYISVLLTQSLLIFANQWMVLYFSNRQSTRELWIDGFNNWMQIGAILNFLLYAVLIYVYHIQKREGLWKRKSQL